jgi:hypothetical protein
MNMYQRLMKSHWVNENIPFHMAHPVVNVTEEQVAAAIAGLDPDKEPYLIMFLLRPSVEAGPARGAESAVQGALLFWPMADLAQD